MTGLTEDTGKVDVGMLSSFVEIGAVIRVLELKVPLDAPKPLKSCLVVPSWLLDRGLVAVEAPDAQSGLVSDAVMVEFRGRPDERLEPNGLCLLVVCDRVGNELPNEKTGVLWVETAANAVENVETGAG